MKSNVYTIYFQECRKICSLVRQHFPTVERCVIAHRSVISVCLCHISQSVSQLFCLQTGRSSNWGDECGGGLCLAPSQGRHPRHWNGCRCAQIHCSHLEKGRISKFFRRRPRFLRLTVQLRYNESRKKFEKCVKLSRLNVQQICRSYVTINQKYHHFAGTLWRRWLFVEGERGIFTSRGGEGRSRPRPLSPKSTSLHRGEILRWGYQVYIFPFLLILISQPFLINICRMQLCWIFKI